ncbi:MAG: helix-turn-helix domain-containing protein [Candidatus Omnitrophica bacterium]|nr:helix-turn-helix domain-containing protein [Candidatus Omnitrophota bacterium]
MTDARMTITEAADMIGVTAKTIMRWEQAGKVQKAKRDWRGWRFYTEQDLENLKNFKECVVYSQEA